MASRRHEWVSEWIQNVESGILRHRLFQPHQRIVVAVSGGVDSMVLLHLLHGLAPKHGWRLQVAHFNHQLRGAASDADQALVAKTAASLHLPFAAGNGEVRQSQQEQGVSLEMAARQLRHEFLAAAALEWRGQSKELKSRQKAAVVLAHHADDQLEAFFLRLFRGAGAEGVAGMKWLGLSPVHADVQLARPLLDQPKSALLRYAKRQKIVYREDASNALNDFLRNRIRNELLPLLRQDYQPALNTVISRYREVAGGEGEYVRSVADAWLSAARTTPFADLHRSVQRQVIRRQLLQAGIEASFDLTEHLRMHPENPLCFQPGRAVALTRNGKLILSRTESPVFLPSTLGIHLPVRESQAGFGGFQFRWEMADGKTKFKPANFAWADVPSPLGGKKSKSDNCIERGVEYFDADHAGAVIVLRHWRPGDRFQPIGMTQPVKLQNLFTNSGIPAAQRRQLVLAESQDQGIFWVQGLRIGEQFKIRPATRRILRWEWKRQGRDALPEV